MKLFTTNRTKQLKEILEKNKDNVWTIQTIAAELKVDRFWVTKNKEKLEQFGFNIQRKTHKEHKTHSNKGISTLAHKTRTFYETLDLKKDLYSYHHLLIRLYTNLAYYEYGLAVPFDIQSSTTEKGLVEKEFYDLLKNRVLAANINYIEVLKDILILSKKAVYPIPLNIKIYIEALLNSEPYLNATVISNTILKLAISAFKDLYPTLEPTSEQLQTIGKGYQLGIGLYQELKIASIQSDSGASKTTCAKVIQRMLNDTEPYITAITNKALNRIEHSSTVCKLLSEVAGINLIKDTRQEQILKAQACKSSIPFLIVDESSQCGESTRMLLELIAERVLYIGDVQQLPAMNEERGTDIIYLHALTKQYRFLNSTSDLQIKYSQYNKLKEYESAKELYANTIKGSFNSYSKTIINEENDLEVNQITDYTNSFKDYIQFLMQYQDDNSIIISYAQNAVDAINYILNGFSYDFKIGGKVMLIVNDYEAEQYNGFQYRITKIESKYYTCKSIETGCEYTFRTSQLSHAYAITTMKCQGSEWEHVLGIDGTLKPRLYTDRYVTLTRAKVSYQCLTKNKTIILSKPTISNNLDLLLECSEGNRNNTLYSFVRSIPELTDTLKSEIIQIMLDKGLEESEILATINSARQGTSVSKTKKLPPSNNIILDSLDTNSTPRLTQYFTPVFKNHKTLLGKDRILSKEEALAYPNILYVAEELKGGNRIVIDCDSKETVELFSEYLSQTESYASVDKSSAHLVFTTDRLIRSSHKEGIDLLGNTLYTLRNIKDNKVYNDLKAIPLTQEILDLYENL